MFVNESANPSSGGSKTVEPSTDIDNPENLNFWEPSDEEETSQQANPQDGQEGIESETDETAEEAGQESEEAQDAETDEESEANEGGEPEKKAKDDIVVTLKGGEKVPLEELKLGYMRERDYRLKTQENANKGRSLEEMTARVTRTVDAVANYLAEMLPAEPQPALAMQNPGEYTRQKAIYDAALGQLNKIISMANEPKQVASKLTAEQEQEMLSREDEALAAAFPQTRKSRQDREKFFSETFDTARELGFTDEELKGHIDHRMFKLAYWARRGLDAEKAKTKALTKVANAPPAVPTGKSNGPAVQQARKNQDAMKKLSKTGSIKDAMMIDFD